MKRAILSVFLTLGVCLAPGCSKGPPRAKTYPVIGSVTLDGKPLKNALITFHPVDANTGVIANATSDASGNFKATTYVSEDGAAQGEYAVTIEAKELIKNGNEFVFGPNLLPAKLTNPKTTDWKIQIAAQEKNELPPKSFKR